MYLLKIVLLFVLCLSGCGSPARNETPFERRVRAQQRWNEIEAEEIYRCPDHIEVYLVRTQVRFDREFPGMGYPFQNKH